MKSLDNLYPLKPDDAQYYKEGTHYKVGTHGLLYHWINGGWIRSGKDHTQGKNMKDARFDKILGILGSSASQQINVVKVARKYQLLSGDKLLLEISTQEFDKLTVHEILKKAGVPIR